MSELATIQPAGNAAAIIQAALDPQCDAEKMERMFALAERMRANESRVAYAAAMTQAQAAIEPIKKNARNDQTNSRYATLDSTMDSVGPVAAEFGFALSFGTEQSPLDEHIRVTCTVQHSAGHSELFAFDAPLDIAGIKGSVNKTRMHASGSTMSYARRYLVGLIFNLAFKDDDDGQKSSTSPRIHGAYAPDGSFQPPLAYAVRVCAPSIDAVVDSIRSEDYMGAWQCYSELTQGEQMALKVAPSKDGPWPQDVWNQMQGNGEFRLWVTEHLRQMRQDKQVNAHEGQS